MKDDFKNKKMDVSESRIEKLYYDMLLIRKFEERILELFSQGILFGTTHTYIGQEANAAGIINNLNSQDIVVSNHRCHGHYIAFTKDVGGLMAELMGKETGVCGGRAGSQHICKKDVFYTNGILGGTVPLAVGMAWAEKLKKSGKIVISFLGDGTMAQGIVYESLNIAALWQLPILFVVENNRYAQSTPIKQHLAGTILARAQAFGIKAGEIETNDAEEIYMLFAKIIPWVRENNAPFFQIVHTYRLAPHSKGDDFRPEEEIEEWRKKDPLKIIEKRIPIEKRNKILKMALRIIEEAEEGAKKASFPDDLGAIG